jgi:hypothetical protein
VGEDDTRIARPTALYPSPDITPEQFEHYVADELLRSAGSEVDGLKVTVHEKIAGPDGTYDFDATLRFNVGGMSFLTLVEAKLHKNPIKRQLVQVLYQKVQSVGAHKGVMISTAPYQVGALTFARAHGVALVKVTEGRFLYEVRGADRGSVPTLSREEAAERYGLPTFVSHYYGAGEEPRSTQSVLLSLNTADYSGHVANFLLGRPVE